MLAAAKARVPARVPQPDRRDRHVPAARRPRRSSGSPALVVARGRRRGCARERGIELEVDDALVARLARDGFDEEFGARPLQRHVRRTLEKELTRAILDGALADGRHASGRRDGPDGMVLRPTQAPAVAA